MAWHTDTADYSPFACDAPFKETILSAKKRHPASAALNSDIVRREHRTLSDAGPNVGTRSGVARTESQYDNVEVQPRGHASSPRGIPSVVAAARQAALVNAAKRKFLERTSSVAPDMLDLELELDLGDDEVLKVTLEEPTATSASMDGQRISFDTTPPTEDMVANLGLWAEETASVRRRNRVDSTTLSSKDCPMPKKCRGCNVVSARCNEKRRLGCAHFCTWLLVASTFYLVLLYFDTNEMCNFKTRPDFISVSGTPCSMTGAGVLIKHKPYYPKVAHQMYGPWNLTATGTRSIQAWMNQPEPTSTEYHCIPTKKLEDCMEYCCQRPYCASYAFVDIYADNNRKKPIPFPTEFFYGGSSISQIDNFKRLSKPTGMWNADWGCLGKNATNAPIGENATNTIPGRMAHCFTFNLNVGQGMWDSAEDKENKKAKAKALYEQLQVNKTVNNTYPEGQVITGAKSPDQIGDGNIAWNLLPDICRDSKHRSTYQAVAQACVGMSVFVLGALASYAIWLRVYAGYLGLRLAKDERPSLRRMCGHFFTLLPVVVLFVFVPYSIFYLLTKQGRFHAPFIIVMCCILLTFGVLYQFYGLLREHLSNYLHPRRQRRVIRCAMIVPIYAMDASFAICWTIGVGGRVGADTTVLTVARAIRHLYEAYTVFNFIEFLLESVEYEAKRRTYLEKHGPMQVYDKQKESDIGIFSLEIDEETDLELEYIDDQAIIDELERGFEKHPSDAWCPRTPVLPLMCKRTGRCARCKTGSREERGWRGRDFLYKNRTGVLQYVVVETILTVLMVIFTIFGGAKRDEDGNRSPETAENEDFYNEGDWTRINKPFLYMQLCKYASQLVSVHCLVYLYYGTRRILHEYHPSGKVWSIKLVVFYSTIQHLFFSFVCKKWHIIADHLPFNDYWPNDENKVIVWVFSHSLLCFEMLIAGYFHREVFSYKDFLTDGAKRRTLRQALRHVFSWRDFKADLTIFCGRSKIAALELAMTPQENRVEAANPLQQAFIGGVNSQIMFGLRTSSKMNPELHPAGSAGGPPVQQSEVIGPRARRNAKRRRRKTGGSKEEQHAATPAGASTPCMQPAATEGSLKPSMPTRPDGWSEHTEAESRKGPGRDDSELSHDVRTASTHPQAQMWNSIPCNTTGF